MAPMAGGTPTIQIPRWIQLVGLPVLALLALVVVGKVFHAVFLFIVAALIALLLDPLVRGLGRLRIPRGFSIAIVYLSFAAAARRRRDRRRRPRRRSNADGCGSNRRLPYGRARTDRPDRVRRGRRPAPALARHARARARRHPRAGTRVRRQRRGAGRREVHDEGDRLPARSGDLDLPARLQLRADPRRLDLHAARHGAVGRRRRPALPAAPGDERVDPPHRERARRLRARAAPALRDHRRERRRLALGARDARLGAGRGQVRDPLRSLGRDHRADPLPRPLARGDPADRSTRSSSTRCPRSG